LRFTSLLVLSTFVVAVVMSPMRLALASPPTPSAQAQPQVQAEEHFLRAVALYRDGDLEGAYIEFKRAHQISPHYRILYNLATVSIERHDYARAISFYEQYLRDGGAALPEDRRRDVTLSLAELETRVGQLTIETESEGWRLFVNDTLVGTPVPHVAVAATLRDPIEEAGVLVTDGISYPMQGMVSRQGHTDAEGHLRLTGFPARGKLLVTLAPKEGHTAGLSTTRLARDLGQNPMPLVMQPPARIQGVLAGPIPTDLQIVAIDEGDATEVARTTVGATGAFALDVPRARDYMLWARAQNAANAPSMQIARVRAELDDQAPLSARYPRGSTLSGVIVDARGAPVAGAIVAVRCDHEQPSCIGPAARPFAQSVTDPAGRYRILLPDPASE
jgi:hypothetical protein